MREIMDKRSLLAVGILGLWLAYSNLSLPEQRQTEQPKLESAENNLESKEETSFTGRILNSLNSKMPNLLADEKTDAIELKIGSKDIRFISGLELSQIVDESSRKEADHFLLSSLQKLKSFDKCRERLCYTESMNLEIFDILNVADMYSGIRNIKNQNLNQVIISQMSSMSQQNQKLALNFIEASMNPKDSLLALIDSNRAMDPFAVKNYVESLANRKTFDQDSELGPLLHEFLLKQALHSGSNNAIVLLKEFKHSPLLVTDLENFGREFCEMRNDLSQEDKGEADASLYIGMRQKGLSAKDFPNCG